jgi:hypothetical protein
MPRYITLPYMAVFTVFDLLLPLAGIYLHLFQPSVVLTGFTPSPASSIAPETRVLLDAMAGWFAGLVVLHLYVRFIEPSNLSLWRALQAALVLVDIFQLIGFYGELNTQRRTQTKDWRGEDWQNIVGYTGLTLTRLSFVLGIGKSKVQAKGAKKQ